MVASLIYSTHLLSQGELVSVTKDFYPQMEGHVLGISGDNLTLSARPDPLACILAW